MLINELITRLRARLKDEGKHIKYSDDEILACINQEQNILIYSLDLNVCYFSKEINEEENTLTMPKIFLKLLFAKLNGKAIAIKGFLEHIQNENAQTHLFSYANMQTVALEPKNRANGLLEVWANVCVFHQDKDEELFINDLFVNALLFGCLKNLFQSENSQESLQKIAYYDTLYQKELRVLKDIVANTRTKPIFYSRVNEV